MSPVDFKKRQCRSVEFVSKGPSGLFLRGIFSLHGAQSISIFRVLLNDSAHDFKKNSICVCEKKYLKC